MKITDLRSHLQLPLTLKPSNKAANSAVFIPNKRRKLPPIRSTLRDREQQTIVLRETQEPDTAGYYSDDRTRYVLLGALSIGAAFVAMGFDDHFKAMALGPEGPLMEEFWDNMRRYVLYALTVSTGALYIVLKPIVELLKNPLTAILVIVILGGGFYVVSQVLYAMVGVNEFNYDYGY